MRKTAIAAVALCAFAGATAAHADPLDFYVTVESGALVTTENDFSVSPTPAFPLAASGSFDAGSGYMAGIGAGVIHSSGLRAGLDFFYSGLSPNSVDLTSPVVGSAGLSGDASALGVFADIGYEYPGWGAFRPFVEAGVGLVRVHTDALIGGIIPIDDSDMVLAGRVGAGFAVEVLSGWDFMMSYHYMFGESAELDINGPAGIVVPVDTDVAGHMFGVGLRYRL